MGHVSLKAPDGAAGHEAGSARHLPRAVAALVALACAACAPTWTGRYAALDGGWTPTTVRRSFELRLDQLEDGRVLGELRSDVRAVGLSLRATDERTLSQGLELQDVLLVPVQSRDEDGPPVIGDTRRLDAGPYRLTLERGDEPSLLLLRLVAPADLRPEVAVQLVRIGAR